MHILLSAVAIAASLRGHDIGRSFGSVLDTKMIHIYGILELKNAQEIIKKKRNPLVTDEETTTKNKALSPVI